VLYINKLSANRKIIAVLSEPAHEHSPHVQFAPDRLRVGLFSFVAQHGAERDDLFQIWQLRKTINHAVAESVCKVFRGWSDVGIDERQHCERIYRLAAAGGGIVPSRDVEIGHSRYQDDHGSGSECQGQAVALDFVDQIFGAGSWMDHANISTSAGSCRAIYRLPNFFSYLAADEALQASFDLQLLFKILQIESHVLDGLVSLVSI